MKSLLYIDDLVENTDSLKKEFAGHFKLDTVNCPITAYELLKEKRYDVILIDVLMPILDGVSLYKKLMSNSLINSSSVIFKTSSMVDEVRLSALDLNREVLTFNMTYQEMLIRIKNQVDKTVSLQVSEAIEIDKENITVKLNGEVIPFTLIEYKMFLTLAESKGNLVSKDAFVKRVWGSETTFIEDNTINSHLSNVRRKIKDSSCKISKVGSHYTLK
jgi:two-component system alkaline phosphatase synthesis response regulator PhoP